MTLSLAQRITAQQQVLRRLIEPPATTKRMHGVDISNYTDPLSAGALASWQLLHDVGLVIVQAVDPPPGYPPGETREQLAACAAAGLATDAYLYLWTNSNVEADMRAKLALLSGLEQHIGRLWLDAEDTSAASPAARISAIRQAFAVLDGWSSAHGKPTPGLYTGRWWWMAYVNNTPEFANRALWTSQYDTIDDASVFMPYGGWERCAVKQYSGTSQLAGINGVDLNVLAP